MKRDADPKLPWSPLDFPSPGGRTPVGAGVLISPRPVQHGCLPRWFEWQLPHCSIVPQPWKKTACVKQAAQSLGGNAQAGSRQREAPPHRDSLRCAAQMARAEEEHARPSLGQYRDAQRYLPECGPQLLRNLTKFPSRGLARGPKKNPAAGGASAGLSTGGSPWRTKSWTPNRASEAKMTRRREKWCVPGYQASQRGWFSSSVALTPQFSSVQFSSVQFSLEARLPFPIRPLRGLDLGRPSESPGEALPLGG